MNTALDSLVRPSIRKLAAYSSARHEFTGSAGIFLDANESPYPSGANRYPDAAHKELKSRIAALKSVPENQIFLGNGSDEAIDIIMRIFAEPGKDAILQFSPTYGMYSVLAQINNLQVIDAPLNDDFQLNIAQIRGNLAKYQHIKILFICSPNNPTGNLMQRADVVNLLNLFQGIVVIDEAYIDFATEQGFRADLENYPNLILLQTLSKAYGMAGLRVGMAFAAPEIIAYMNKVKYPYNISLYNQQKALEMLEQTKVKEQITQIVAQRNNLVEFLGRRNWVAKLYPTEANFIFFTTGFDALILYQFLKNKGIVIRNRQSQYPNALRISVGTPEENQQLMNALGEFENDLLNQLKVKA